MPAAVAYCRIPAGVAYLGDWKRTKLYVRDGGRLDADCSGTLFDTNQVSSATKAASGSPFSARLRSSGST